MAALTYQGDRFYLDGEPFVIRSGAIHYFRTHQDQWYDRLLKLKECGFNCVETYTCWNLHEPREGEFHFDGMLDIARFVDTAASLGLYVILRPGPYICAEWDFGGLPSWLLTYPDMPLRCNDATYLSKVRRYYVALFDRLRSRLASRGGNILMLQVENEYGSYGNDHDYLRAVLELYRELDMDALYFTSDGPTNAMLNGGTLPDCLCVANFGSHPVENFEVLRRFRPEQPLMCGEYWGGWFDHWGEAHHTRPADEIVAEFQTFVDNDWSINVYMFHGGTNFGFTNGANHFGTFAPTVTSYDYGALLTEAGDRTEAYYRFRDVLIRHGEDVPPLTAADSEKAAYGAVTLTEAAALFDALDILSAPHPTVAPTCMEAIGQSFGYILYRTTLRGPFDDWRLDFDHLHDRARVFVNGTYRTTYDCRFPIADEDRVTVPLAVGETATLDILVENMGRVNYGPKLRDGKGAVGIRFNGQYHFGWEMYPLPMDDLSRLTYRTAAPSDDCAPVFLRGTLTIEGCPKDTFLRTDGMGRGFVTVNGFNLGRFDNIGPTRTLYVPAPVLREGKNEVVVFASDGVEATTVIFTDMPDLG